MSTDDIFKALAELTLKEENKVEVENRRNLKEDFDSEYNNTQMVQNKPIATSYKELTSNEKVTSYSSLNLLIKNIAEVYLNENSINVELFRKAINSNYESFVEVMQMYDRDTLLILLVSLLQK